MEKKRVPKNKLSKKEKRELARKARVTWAFSPVSRVRENKKVYRRGRESPPDTDI